MKKIKDIMLHHRNVSGTLASMALTFAVVGANTCCCCLYHQPDKPDLKALRRF